MNTNPKISIIVPIYNNENYLPETLHSILKQSMIEEMEVLMIDDGSTDNSRDIVEEYALDYDNFFAYAKNKIENDLNKYYVIDSCDIEELIVLYFIEEKGVEMDDDSYIEIDWKITSQLIEKLESIIKKQ